MTTLNVGTLRIRSGDGDPVALRLRTERELQAADLAPPGLPPASVLVVRQLTDPMPRRFAAGRVRPRPEWERAVRSALEAAARTARRPDEAGRIDPAADAVLFEDEAQLLACLIVERVHGRAGSSWWWKTLLPRLHVPNVDLPGSVRDPAFMLAVKPQETPAAIACIMRWREAVPVARACSIEGAKLCVAALLRAYDLPTELTIGGVDSVTTIPLQSPNAAEHQTRNDATRVRGITVGATSLARVPREVAHAGVPFEVQRLFGLALGLRHGTAPVRETAIGADPRSRSAGTREARSVNRNPAGTLGEAAGTGVREHKHEQSTQTGSASDASAEPRVTAELADTDSPSGLSNVGIADRCEPRAAGPASAELNRTAPPAADGFTTNSGIAAERTPQTGGVSQGAPEPGSPRHSSAALTRGARAVRVEQPVPAVRELPAVFSTEGVVTRLGGIFYLIHALQALNVPAAFEPAWRLEGTAASWGTLDLIARALIGRRFAQSDPIWKALAHLTAWPAARHREIPAERGLLPHAAGNDPTFAVPRAWRTELDDPLEQLAWTLTGARLWLWSQNGYVLAARRTTAGNRDAAARRACRLHAEGASLTSAPPHAIPWMPPAALPRGCPVRLGRWAAAIAPAVLRRLQLAFDVTVASRCARLARPRPILQALATPARLYVTSSHVDVVIPLQRIDLRVRRAGLDRDPGWLPSYGRVIYFHFE